MKVVEVFDLKKDISHCKVRFLIPTLNRPRELYKTLEWNLDAIEKSSQNYEIQILISENCSDDKYKLDLVHLDSISQKFSRGSVYLVRQKERLNLNVHFRLVSSLGDCEWHIWCGDDDLINQNYICEVLAKIIHSGGRDAFIPGIANITQDEFFKASESSGDLVNSIYLPKVKRAWYSIYRGHQLSGVVVPYKIAKEVNSELSERNHYPWIAYLGRCLRFGKITHYPQLKTRVTTGTPKLFCYGQNGLVPDIDEAIHIGYGYSFKSLQYSLAVFIRPFILGRMLHVSTNFWVRVYRYTCLFFDCRLRKSIFFISYPFFIYRLIFAGRK